MKKLLIISLFIGASMQASEWDNATEAIRLGDLQALQTALNNDPDIIDRRYLGGGTLLHGTVSRPNSLALAEFLIMRGIDVNAQDSGGNTALLDATRYGDDNLVELLLNHGADINLENEYGHLPLEVRVGTNRSLRSDDPRVTRIYGLLHNAQRKKDKEAAEKKQKATSACPQ